MRQVAQPGHLTQRELSIKAGCSQSLLNAWHDRYGWPVGRRLANGYRVYPDHLVEPLRRVLALVRGGRPPREIIIDGQPRFPVEVSVASPPRLDFGDIPAPCDAYAIEVRDRLILGLVQRHPGIIRWAAAQCARLRPSDRGPAFLLIINAYRRQVTDHGWLDPILEG